METSLLTDFIVSKTISLVLSVNITELSTIEFCAGLKENNYPSFFLAWHKFLLRFQL